MEDTTLNDLLRQKKEIEEKIKQARANCYIACGDMKLEKKNQEDHPWQVASKLDYVRPIHESRAEYERRTGNTKDYRWNRKENISSEIVPHWIMFIRENTKEDVIEKIRKTIDDLSTILEQIK